MITALRSTANDQRTKPEREAHLSIIQSLLTRSRRRDATCNELSTRCRLRPVSVAFSSLRMLSMGQQKYRAWCLMQIGRTIWVAMHWSGHCSR